MVPAQFEYQRAGSLEEAFALLTSYEDAKFIAGGHSLIPMMKLRLAQPEAVIDIARIDALRGISLDDNQVRIGALTTHHQLATSELLRAHCLLLAEAASTIGDPQVRNRGTIGGNIAHADPASDLPAVLVAIGASIHLQSARATRTVAAADFFVDLLTTDLGADELVVAISMPALATGSGSAYLKFEHPASGYAVVGAAAIVELNAGSCTRAALSINGVTATPFDGNSIACALVGGTASDEVISELAEQIQPSEPLSDVFATGEYRSHLARVYARRALIAARDRCG